MALNRDVFIGKYLEELNENIDSIEKSVLVLKNDPNNEDELASLLRSLHTIKGSSRMLKFNNIEKVSHSFENVFKGVKEKRYEVSKNLIQLIFIGTNLLKSTSNIIKEKKHDDINIEIIDNIDKICNQVYSNEPYNIDELKRIINEIKNKSNNENINEKISQENEINKKPDIIENKIANYETIRVKTDKIDILIKQINELIIKQFQLKKTHKLLDDLEENFIDFFLDLKDLSNKNNNINNEYKNILKQIQKMKKDFYEHISQIENKSFELQENIVNLKMLPLEMILGGIPKMVEETAISLNKEIDISITGMEIMLDKAILEKINDPIIHIIRNSIDHGIENEEERIKKGKNKKGLISIHCYSESGNIIIKIKDDGKGIDYDKIRKKVIDMNPSLANEVNQLSDKELNNYLFMSGFSTKQEVSELSGRGVGLDIVKYNIEKIKGKIDIISEKDKGTEFILTLPLTLATIEGFFTIIAGKKFFIPSTFIKEIIILKNEDKINIINKKVFKLRDKIIPLYNLNQLIDPEYQIEEKNTNFVIIVQVIGETIGFIIETIIEFSSMIFRPLPKNLQKINSLNGIVLDENFNMISILHIPGIIEKFKFIKNISFKERYTNRRNKSILVVDDSINTREIEKSILELENYQVLTAVDGIDGLNVLKNNEIDLIVTDINMPRMDGFTFLENIRREEKYKNIPVIVVSSNDDFEHKNKSKLLGANDYIVKSDFDRNNLVDSVKKFIG